MNKKSQFKSALFICSVFQEIFSLRPLFLSVKFSLLYFHIITPRLRFNYFFHFCF